MRKEEKKSPCLVETWGPLPGTATITPCRVRECKRLGDVSLLISTSVCAAGCFLACKEIWLFKPSVPHAGGGDGGSSE